MKHSLYHTIKREITNMLNEANIGQFLSKLDIIYKIDKTDHATERQSRHNARDITDAEIAAAIEKAIPKLANAFLFDEIDIGDKVLITNRATNLNIVAQTKPVGNRIQLIVITVMITPYFTAHSYSYAITV